MEQVADGVYVIVHDNATDEWPHGNTGVIVGRETLFVVDSTYLPSRAKADIALIRQVTNKPVRYLMTTHWHFDHNNGASAYRDAFPNVELVAERNTARWIDLNATYWSKMSTAPQSTRRAALTALETTLAAGVDEKGTAFSDTDREARAHVIAQRKAELDDLASLVVLTPTKLFDERLDLDFEGRRIELVNWGPANSPDDSTIYLPKERVLFLGDILVQSPLPFVGACWPIQWVDVLAKLEQIPADVIVPGHGPVLHDFEYARAFREFLETTLVRVEALAREGKTLDEVKATLDLSDVRARVPAWNVDVTADDWTYTVTTLAERAWRAVRGQG
ncbi:MAG: MBL fold metallo-hydrolase [Planctomycetes bacterium]|nr:MBL fold metallo-hydrolase [Planctomycetota bacterium]